MKKDVEDIKSKSKLLFNNEVEATDLKILFDYSTNYNLLFDIVDDIINAVSHIKATSRPGNYQYLLRLVPCIAKLIYFEDIMETSPIYHKIEEAINIISIELTKIHSKKLNQLLAKIQSSLIKIVDILDSEEYINRHIVEAEEKEKLRIRREQAKQIIRYILFEVKDIKLLINIKNEYIKEAIKLDIDYIIRKVCDEYLYGVYAFDEYYVKLFLFLSAEPNFEVSAYADNMQYIINTFKEFMTAEENSEVVELHKDRMMYILEKITTRDCKRKYDIPTPIKSTDFNCDFNINVGNNIIDLRNKKYIFTIDPNDATCLDDALSYEVLPNGNVLIGIYIADITDIVLAGSNLDEYAYNIAETIYYSKEIPMLPKAISSDFGSLRVGADKLVQAFTFEVDPEYTIVDARVDRALIRVNDNYTYGKIDELILNGGNLPFANDLRNLYDYSKYLLGKNVRRQIYMHSKEALDPTRKANDRFGNNPSNRIISELKVLTNSHWALKACEFDIPFIFRNNLKNQKTGNPNFTSIITDPEFVSIKCALAASYGTSYYSALNEGHFGLDVDAYAHIAIPLRNYCAEFNQRMIGNYFLDQDIYNVDADVLRETASSLADYLNERILLNKMYIDECYNKKKMLTK
nr:RNB domain-containing ribonuclease [Bacilli bacterium]